MCGSWSVKNIVGHLTSYEWVLVDVFKENLADEPAPILTTCARRIPRCLTMRRSPGGSSNCCGSPCRVQRSLCCRAGACSAGIGRVAAHGRSPAFVWHGLCDQQPDRVQYYGHRREHMAQVNILRDRLRNRRRTLGRRARQFALRCVAPLLAQPMTPATMAALYLPRGGNSRGETDAAANPIDVGCNL